MKNRPYLFLLLGGISGILISLLDKKIPGFSLLYYLPGLIFGVTTGIYFLVDRGYRKISHVVTKVIVWSLGSWFIFFLAEMVTMKSYGENMAYQAFFYGGSFGALLLAALFMKLWNDFNALYTIPLGLLGGILAMINVTVSSEDSLYTSFLYLIWQTGMSLGFMIILYLSKKRAS